MSEPWHPVDPGRPGHGQVRSGFGRDWVLAPVFMVCSYLSMSHLRPSDRDILIPPPPVRISRADGRCVGSDAPRFAPPRQRLGAVQEASLVGIIALSLSWAAAEIALWIWG
jgi:hypothetical protein